MKALDLFCGLGGWSDGLALEGFEIIGVEINPEVANEYKHQVIISDVRDIKGEDFQGYELIVGSPPCRDFSIFAKRFGSTWKKNPPNPERGLELIHAFLKIVSNADPIFWLMENVPGLIPHLDLKPRLTRSLGRRSRNQMRRTFWGNFPSFLIPTDLSLKTMRFRPEVGRPTYSGKFARWERARIPMPVARALGRAVKNNLT